MNIKKFVAKNAREAIQMVKKDMGQDAVILRTRTIYLTDKETKIPGRKIEVTAAIDYDTEISNTTDTNPVHDKLLVLQNEIKEIKEALLSTDAGSTLLPEIYFNQKLKDL